MSSRDIFVKQLDDKAGMKKHLVKDGKVNIALRLNRLDNGDANHFYDTDNFRIYENPVFDKLQLESGIKDFISGYVKYSLPRQVLTVQNVKKLLDISKANESLKSPEKKIVFDFEAINNKNHINRYLFAVNAVLVKGGIYIGKVETHKQRNRRVYSGWNIHISRILIYFEFIVHRIMPKIRVLRNPYFYITKRRYRFLSLTETLGRMVFCGFRILDYKEINGLTYFIVKKEKNPEFKYAPLYGPVFKMNRIGKDGKIFKIYKFRTMHSYAEYLQDFVIHQNGYNELGKPANDFRVARWGRFLRKYWLDELPQLINVLKGEMKLVSIRPVSHRFLKEYPEDIRNKRMKFKPGCIPPYVALLKQGVEEYINAEKIYMDEVEKHPYITDLKYFAKAVYNILTRKIKSA